MADQEHARRPGNASAATPGAAARAARPGSATQAMAARLAAAPAVVAQRRLSGELNAAAARRTAGATALPEGLKAGAEALSGIALDGIRLHRNSAKPAQLRARAYTKGADIHLGPGQDCHLAHEVWHAVQQAQGRVTATRAVGATGGGLNDDPSLEAEADRMGALALRTDARPTAAPTAGPPPRANAPVQRMSLTPPGTAEFPPYPMSAHVLPVELAAELGRSYDGTGTDRILDLALAGPMAGWAKGAYFDQFFGPGQAAGSWTIHLFARGDNPSFFLAKPGPSPALSHPLHLSELPARLGQACIAHTEALMAGASLPFVPEDLDWAKRSFFDEYHGRGGADGTWRFSITTADWQFLGRRDAPPGMDTGTSSDRTHESQRDVMAFLGKMLEGTSTAKRKAAIRIATFRLSKADGRAEADSRPLTATWVTKAIEEAVQGHGVDDGAGELKSIDDAHLEGKLLANVQRVVSMTLFESGQMQWLARHYHDIAATHDIFMDVDYYHDRPPSQAGLHKDSIGETLFVNLNFNNENSMLSSEFAHDNATELHTGLPDAAKGLVESIRDQQKAANMPGIASTFLGKYARVSFVDPAIWHSTPLHGHRPATPEAFFAKLFTPPAASPGTPDVLLARTEDVGNAIASLLPDDRRANLVDRIAYYRAQVADDAALKGGDLIAARHAYELYGLFLGDVFAHANYVPSGGKPGEMHKVDMRGPDPSGRRPRALSFHLHEHPEHEPQVKQMALTNRSFLRTWIILKPKS